MGRYKYGGRQGPLSKSEKKKRAETRRRNRITKEFVKTSDLYDYDSIVFSKEAAEFYKLNVYWSICKSGHIGEFNLRGDCKTCQKVHQGIRDAKIRGSTAVKLTAAEKKEIAEIYSHAKRMTRETGVEHHVDHIRPLAAGGEHHPYNLRVIPASENLSKGSSYNGKNRSYSKREKKEISKELRRKQMDQLEAVYEEKFQAEYVKYEERLKSYNEKSFIWRIFSKKPTPPSKKSLED